MKPVRHSTCVSIGGAVFFSFFSTGSLLPLELLRFLLWPWLVLSLLLLAA